MGGLWSQHTDTQCRVSICGNTFLDGASRRLFASVSLNKMKGHNSEPDSLLGTVSELL